MADEEQAAGETRASQASATAATAPEPIEEPDMEIHKPKPWHNWREFLKEVGTIVLGVGIALAAEQGVEYVHWRNQVAEARNALAAELGFILAGAVQRVRIYDCLERRMDFVSATLDKASAAGSLPPVPYISVAPGASATWPRGVWDTVVASQTATHFPRSELNALGTVYAMEQKLSEDGAHEWQVWSSLNAMVGPGRRLDPASEAELRNALSQARASNLLMTLVSGQIMMAIDGLNLPFSPQSRRNLEIASRGPLRGEVCRPMPAAAPAFYGPAIGPSRIPEIRNYQQHLPFASH